MPRASFFGPAARNTVILLHALALLSALAVPAFAVGDALMTLLRADSPEPLLNLLDLHRWLILLTNTLLVVAVALLAALGIGGALGLLVTRTDWPGGRLLAAAALFGACVPVYVSAVVFFALLPAYHLAGSAVACGLLYGLVYAPLAGLILGCAFRSVDGELEEQALLDAPPASVLLRVTVPQAGWGVASAAMLIGLLVATDFTLTDILTVRTFAEEVFTQYSLDRRHAGPLLTALPVLGALAIGLLFVQTRYRLLGEHPPWHRGAAPRRFALGPWRTPACAVTALLLAAGLGLPVALLCMHVGSLRGLAPVIAGLLPEVLTSAILAACGATLIVLPAVGLSAHLVRGGRWRWVTAGGIIVLLALPAPVAGISLIALLNNDVLGWLYDSALVLVVGYFLRLLPVAVLLLLPAVQRVPRELEDAARVDGCDWLGIHLRIRWPLMLNDVAVVWLVLVILCFAEIGTTHLLAPPGVHVAAVRTFTLIHFGVYRDLAVLALLAVGFILLPWSALWWRLHRPASAAHS